MHSDDMNTGEPHPPGQVDFHHPFTPYDVQLEFMQTVYNVLESGNGQVGILESPTGTVSQLSVTRLKLQACALVASSLADFTWLTE